MAYEAMFATVGEAHQWLIGFVGVVARGRWSSLDPDPREALADQPQLHSDLEQQCNSPAQEKRPIEPDKACIHVVNT
jgi:hypothetical protein